MTTKEKFQVKLFFAAHQMRVVRLAAASRNITPTAFLAEAGLTAAAEEMRAFTPPTLEASPTKAGTKKNV